MDHMKNRYSFSKYIYDLHEHINTMLNKKSGLSYEDVRERYEHFRARCSDDIPKAFDIEKIKNVKNRTLKKTRKTKGKGKEKGCTEPLYGKYAKCVIKIVPQEKKCETMQIDKKCYKTKNVNDIL